MANELPPRFGITPHALRRTATRQIAVGTGVLLLSVVGVFAGVGGSGLFLIPLMGAALVGLGLYGRSVGAAVQVVNKAFNLASLGKLRDAEELLDYAEVTFRVNYIRRVIDLQRGIIATRRGELEPALGYLESAITRPPSTLSRYNDRIQVTAAHALRAMLRAGTGDREGARADIELVRQSPFAAPDSLARAEFAEALVLEQAGDKEALRAHLNRERRLLVEHTHPRERAIVRAYQRMLKATSTTVYRTGAPRELPALEEPELADWAAKISKGAAPFVRARAPALGGEKSLAGEDADGVDPIALRAAEGRFEKTVPLFSRPRIRLGLLWTLLIMLFLAMWQAFSMGRNSVEHARTPAVPREQLSSLVEWSLLLGAVLVSVGLVALMLARARRHTRRFVASLAAVARGDDERAVKELTTLGRSPAYLVGAQSHLALAELAERRGDLPAALAACEAALSRLPTETARAVAADIVLPTILAERAFLFAAMDRSEDARAEMALVAKLYPSYPYLDKARFRVVLVQKARQGDLVGAARLTASSADLPLGPRDELLADLVRAAANPEQAGAGELERLREELRVDAVSRRWIEVVAPAALAAFTRAEQKTDEAEAEAEARAEAEAHAEAEARADAEVLVPLARDLSGDSGRNLTPRRGDAEPKKR